jgi:hypothetical protein
VALRLFINSWRWKDVPFYIRAGKRMATTATEVIEVIAIVCVGVTSKRKRLAGGATLQPRDASLAGAASLLLSDDQSEPAHCVPQGDWVRVL